MVYYVKRKKTDGTTGTYVTEEGDVARKLSKGFDPINFKEITLKDIIAYFRIQIPEKKVKLLSHETYKNAFIVSNVSALNDYINEAARILDLNSFHPDRAKWEDKRKENLQRLEALVAKHKKE